MSQESFAFSSLGLSPTLLQALTDLKFEKPSDIQQQTIPWLLKGRDLIGLAQTGTGKTAAFSLPILQGLTPLNHTQALIIAPTRELAIQVAEHIESLAVHQANVRITVLCGGQDYRPQLKKLQDGAQIVVGTPGRVLDHIQRGSLKLNHLKTFVLDEADEMLRMGFIEDVETILAQLPEQKQMALFSATMPSRIRQIAKQYLNDPVSVEIKMATATVKSIEQRFLFASQGQKPEALLRILAVEDFQGVIVFTRTKSGADEVATFLQAHGHHAMAIHGDLTQALRERIISQFKQGTLNILVATDVAARGLDVDRVTHVINYDIAQDSETYVHRIGRTGRAGRSGVTILFVTPKESRLINSIERHTRQRIEKITIPTDAMIQAAKKQRFLTGISQRLESDHLPAYVEMISEYMSRENIGAKELAAALALQLNHDQPWQTKFSFSLPARTERETNKSFDSRKEKRSKKDYDRQTKPFQADAQQEIYRLDVGRIHGVKPGNIVGAIANEAGLQSRHITGLKIHDYYSTVCLPKGMQKEVVHHLNKAWVCGRQLNLTPLS
ncbi:DEAD/DEAH box helicase [Legionella impletisoli]|uniref:DEAD-box ATP-dependent RNA helicase RhpA n=1 Tax=Legionella impletisoli TaxID=343510 RepID=A0A917JV95_9GAMM|nr:DEAD/DEAH box helicase [Legionella impletisoli]GGI86243.1 ATP-dependent RNA helicase DeaD [Legionella impletisoli]